MQEGRRGDMNSLLLFHEMVDTWPEMLGWSLFGLFLFLGIVVFLAYPFIGPSDNTPY